jgi:glycosyltransferase involved in cell wall biosynthesis
MGTFIKQSIEALVSEGVDISLISPKPFTFPFVGIPYHNYYYLPKTETSNNYDIHYPRYCYLIPKKYLYPLTGSSYRYFVSKYCANNLKSSYDLIHAHFSYPDGYGICEFAKKRHVPLVISSLGTNERKVAFERSLVSKRIVDVLQKADSILAVSEDLVHHIFSLGVDESKVHFVPNGVDINIFKPIDRKQARRVLNLDEDCDIVLYVGSLRQIKGVDYLIEASKLFLGTKTTLLLIGRDDGLKRKLQIRAKELGISNNIRFINQLHHKELPIWMSAADLLVLPSLSEGRPNVILEAFSCGIPVVASNVGGIPELVIDKKNGFLVEARDYNSIAEKVIQLLINEELRLKMGSYARQSVIERDLTWKAHALRTKKIYANLLKKD